jgi:hypothetical protein
MIHSRLIRSLFVLFVSIHVSSSYAANQIGHLDKATADEVTGWACDPDTPTVPVKVKLVFGSVELLITGGALTRTVMADRPSEAAVGQHCGANTPHRFRYVPSAAVKELLATVPADQRMVFVYAADSIYVSSFESLWGSPMQFILNTSSCPAGFSKSGSVAASSFRDYSTTKITTSSTWGEQRATYFWLDGNGTPLPSAPSVSGQSSFGLHVEATHSGNPFLVDNPNSVDAIGVMKFRLPAPTCDVRVRWNSQIRLKVGNGITEDGGSRISAAAIWSEQPATTAFPSSLKHKTKEAVWTGNPYTGSSATSTIALSGSFIVPAGQASSVLQGVRVLALAKDGSACLGDCDWSPENYLWISTSPAANQGLTLFYTYEPL